MRPWSFDDGNHESTITRSDKQPVFFGPDLLFKFLFAKFFAYSEVIKRENGGAMMIVLLKYPLPHSPWSRIERL